MYAGCALVWVCQSFVQPARRSLWKRSNKKKTEWCKLTTNNNSKKKKESLKQLARRNERVCVANDGQIHCLCLGRCFACLHWPCDPSFPSPTPAFFSLNCLFSASRSRSSRATPWPDNPNEKKKKEPQQNPGSRVRALEKQEIGRKTLCVIRALVLVYVCTSCNACNEVLRKCQK